MGSGGNLAVLPMYVTWLMQGYIYVPPPNVPLWGLLAWHPGVGLVLWHPVTR